MANPRKVFGAYGRLAESEGHQFENNEAQRVEEKGQEAEYEKHTRYLLELQQKSHLLGVLGEMVLTRFPLVAQQLQRDIENTLVRLEKMKHMSREQLDQQAQQFMQEGKSRVEDGWLDFDEPGFFEDLDRAEGYLSEGKRWMTGFAKSVFTTHSWEEKGRSSEEQRR